MTSSSAAETPSSTGKKNDSIDSFSSSSPPTPPSSDNRIEVSNMLVVCLIFVVHTMTNAVLFSAWNTDRCLLWGQDRCSPDLYWITQWVSLGHFHVAILLAALARSVYGDPNGEVKLTYLVGVILCLYVGTALVSASNWHPAFWVVQLLVWTVLLVSTGWFTYSEYDEPHTTYRRSTASPRGAVIVGGVPSPSSSRRDLLAATRFVDSDRSVGSFSSAASRGNGGSSRTSSFGGRAGRVPIVAIALGVMVIGAVLQTLELAMDETMAYMGDIETITRTKFQNSATMVVSDKWFVAVILASTLRFFDTEARRRVLWGHIVAMMAYQVMLAGSPGEQMQLEPKRSGGVGTFFMILTAIVGAV